MVKVELIERFCSGSRSQLANRLLDSYQFDGKGIAVYSETILLTDSGNRDGKYASGT